MSRFSIRPDDWDDGWGWGDNTNLNLPFARVLTALYLLIDAADPGDYSNILGWADDYSEQHTPKLAPTCKSLRGQAFGGFPDPIQDFEGFVPNRATLLGIAAFNSTVTRRAATILHEARHHDNDGAPSHDGDGECPAGGNSCDQRFWDWGANAYHISWLAWSSAHHRSMPRTLRRQAAQWANMGLATRFVEDPGFRVQLPRDPSDPITPAVEYTWISGGADDTGIPGPMTPRDSSACFLTRVTGQFKGGGEYFMMDDADGVWQLDGDSQREDAESAIFVNARCVPVSSRVDTHSTSISGIGSKGFVIGDALTEACFLTGLGGSFVEEGDKAQVKVVGDNWELRVSTVRDDGFVRAQAACVPATDMYVSPRYETDKDGASGISASLVNSGASPVRVCAINHVEGRLEGHGEYVDITPHNTASDSDGNPIDLNFPVDWGIGVVENRDDERLIGQAVCFVPG